MSVIRIGNRLCCFFFNSHFTEEPFFGFFNNFKIDFKPLPKVESVVLNRIQLKDNPARRIILYVDLGHHYLSGNPACHLLVKARLNWKTIKSGLL